MVDVGSVVRGRGRDVWCDGEGAGGVAKGYCDFYFPNNDVRTWVGWVWGVFLPWDCLIV